MIILSAIFFYSDTTSEEKQDQISMIRWLKKMHSANLQSIQFRTSSICEVIVVCSSKLRNLCLRK